MKAITLEWLERARDDLNSAEILLTRPDLTNIVAFHAQQAVEKSLKAALEQSAIAPAKTHSLTRLFGLVEPYLLFGMDQDMLDRLDAVYIEARYPGEMGLLPYGKPSQEEANGFYNFARQFYRQVRSALEAGKESDPPEPEVT